MIFVSGCNWMDCLVLRPKQYKVWWADKASVKTAEQLDSLMHPEGLAFPGDLRPRQLRVSAVQRGNKRSEGGKSSSGKHPIIIPVDPLGSDAWRLDPVIEMLKNGGVGIIPTDTLPAIVCDMSSRTAVQRMYAVKQMNEKKPLSILVRGFSDISTYTTGFPTSHEAGQPDYFKLFKKLLPGAYTIILPASKALPVQNVDMAKGKSIQRKSVGVRWADDKICQAILAGVERPLLCTSVHVAEVLAEGTECPDVGSMLDRYGTSGIDFIVDVGPRIAVVSTIIDMTGSSPEVVRHGAADASQFE
ncbi:MAG: hypothetical protein WDW36_010061 [Sanguina aurantia]